MNKIECTHYERGEDDERVQRCLGIVAAYRVWVQHVTRLHDHKGILEVYSTKPLPPMHREIWKLAWAECCEPCTQFWIEGGDEPYDEGYVS